MGGGVGEGGILGGEEENGVAVGVAVAVGPAVRVGRGGVGVPVAASVGDGRAGITVGVAVGSETVVEVRDAVGVAPVPPPEHAVSPITTANASARIGTRPRY